MGLGVSPPQRVTPVPRRASISVYFGLGLLTLLLDSFLFLTVQQYNHLLPIFSLQGGLLCSWGFMTCKLRISSYFTSSSLLQHHRESGRQAR